MEWKKPDLPALLKRLEKPKGPVRAVLDTDTFNELDDQFALSYAVKLSGRLRLEAIYAAPFFNDHSTSPEDGMEKSYQEILHLQSLLGEKGRRIPVFRGSRGYLPDADTPQVSPAAQDLVSRAMSLPQGEVLYVVAIGAVTNLASAILMEPAIIDRIAVVWLGGHARHWQHTREFNLWQDIPASRILFDCGVALIQLPCMGVVSHLSTTKPELREQLQGKNALCDYLYEHACQEGERYSASCCWSRVIWDISAVAWLAGPEDCMQDVLVSSPLLSHDATYSFDEQRHPIRYVRELNRDRIFEDLFSRLQQNESEEVLP